MPTARPFAYNPHTPIAGTIQVGSLSVGTPTSGFTDTPQYWNGADEELGYVICVPIADYNQPTPVSGVTAALGFYRSTGLTDSSFIETAQSVTGQSFTGAQQASIYLTSNGYWNSYPIAPTLTYNTIYSSANNPGNSFVIFNGAKTLNDYFVFVCSWEALNNTSLSSVTWGTENVDIINQNFYQQGPNAFWNIALLKIRITESSVSNQPFTLNFSGNIAGASLASYTLLRYTQLQPSAYSTATKSVGNTTLFIDVSQPPYSTLIVAQTNGSNGATSTYGFASGGSGSITKNFDASMPTTTALFQTSGAISQNNTNTDYGAPNVSIASNTTGTVAVYATFI